MTDRDHVAELVNRALAARQRGEELGLEFELDFAGLTEVERDAFFALLDQRKAQKQEKLEGMDEDIRILGLLADLIAASGAPSGTTLGQALLEGHVGVGQVVSAIRTVPDPLAGRRPD